MPANKASNVSQVGRYALGQPIAAGGMATLHLGRLVGSAGFARTVAIKRLHPHYCESPSFVEAFADEARLAARIRHPNVVPTLDVVRADGELLLVMEYVDGESLSSLSHACVGRIPVPIVVAIVSEMLHGLHSAHEATSESGMPLGIVHRDVSPQNVLVGADGVARLVDFGIARATGRVTTTKDEDLKGKLAYMAPEQIRREGVTRKTDIFAAGVVLWELLTGTRLFASENPGATLEKILVGWVAPPSSIARDLPPGFDEIALRALDAEPSNRFETAREMAVALEDALGRALGRDVGAWVEATAGSALAKRRALIVSAERAAAESDAPLSMSLTDPALADTLLAESLTQNKSKGGKGGKGDKSGKNKSGAAFTGPPPAPPPPPSPPSKARSSQGSITVTTEMLRDADIIAITPMVVETEGTMTSFSGAPRDPRSHGLLFEDGSGRNSSRVSGSDYDSRQLHPEHNISEFELPRRDVEPGLNLGGDSLPPVTFGPTTTKTITNHTAIALLVLAASITLVVGARYATFGGSSAAKATATDTTAETAAATPIATTELQQVTPTPVATITAVAAPTASVIAVSIDPSSPIPTPPLVVTPPAAAATPSAAVVAVAAAAAAKRGAKTRPAGVTAAPARTPCVAKLDPATGKKVYQGDCD